MAKQPGRLLYTDDEFQLYTQAIGQLALAWNELHSTLAMLFCTVMGGGDLSCLIAVWNAIKSDRTQREALLAAAAAHGANLSTFGLDTEIKWLCDRANEIEDTRNDLLHSPLSGHRGLDLGVTISPAIGFGHRRAQKLLNKDLIATARWHHDTSTALSEYALELYCHVHHNRPCPRRPKLPNRPLTKQARPHP